MEARFVSPLRNASVSWEVSKHLLCCTAGKMRHGTHSTETVNPAPAWEPPASYGCWQPDVSSAGVSSLAGSEELEELMRSLCTAQEGRCRVLAHRPRSPLCNPSAPSSAPRSLLLLWHAASPPGAVAELCWGLLCTSSTPGAQQSEPLGSLLGMQTTVGLLEVECLWGRKQSLLPEVIQAR